MRFCCCGTKGQQDTKIRFSIPSYPSAALESIAVQLKCSRIIPASWDRRSMSALLLRAVKGTEDLLL